MPTSQTARDPFQLCGTTIEDKYRVESVVGTGGFGVVYRGVHTGFDEPIAVKCLKLPSELEQEQQTKLLARLQEEGRVLHRLSKLSSGIVQALDVGAITTTKGQWVPYLVLEWLEGETLADWLKGRRERGEGPLTVPEAIKLLAPAARALDVAHGQNVAHRDIKPENLYLTEVNGQQSLKVLDFGIAKVLAQHTRFTAAPAATQKGAAAFTPCYGAPEQFNKKRGATGPWTDVFALALILVELVVGERALDGDDATQLYIAAADPASRPTLRYHGVETSDDVEEVLRQALAVEPTDRFTDAGAFWNALVPAVGTASSPESASLDLSETGDFVTRHGLGLAAEALSQVDRELAVRADQTPADAEPKTEPADVVSSAADGNTTAQGARATTTKPSVAVAVDQTSDSAVSTSPTAIEVAGLDSERPAAATDEGQPAATADSPSGRSGVAVQPDGSTVPSAGIIGQRPRGQVDGEAAIGSGDGDSRGSSSSLTDTGSPLSTGGQRFSGWWMKLLALAALVGAVLLWWQLKKEQQEIETTPPDGTAGTGGQPTPVSPFDIGPDTTHPKHSRGGAAPAPSIRTAKTTSTRGQGGMAGVGGVAAAGGAGGLGDAGLDGGGTDAADADSSVPAIVFHVPRDMVYVPGTTGGDAGRATRGFVIDRTEVSTKAYLKCVLSGHCERATLVVLPSEVAKALGLDLGDAGPKALMKLAQAWEKRCNVVRNELDHPINCVNHASAAAYCRYRGRRLPTSAEWTRAAAGPAGFRYPWGGQAPTCDHSCYGKNGSCIAGSTQVATCPLKSHKKDRTPGGVLNLAGNVSEWVANTIAAAQPDDTPKGVIRGGSFFHEAGHLSTTARAAVPTDTAFVTIGFRCAKSVPQGWQPAGRTIQPTD